MSLEVTPYRNIENSHLIPSLASTGNLSTEQRSSNSEEANQSQGKVPFLIVEQNLKELDGFTRFLNRRLKFSFNEELQQVVVKIVEGDTDKVIKVLPPEEIQKLHLRIRETLGILFDQLI